MNEPDTTKTTPDAPPPGYATPEIRVPDNCPPVIPAQVEETDGQIMARWTEAAIAVKTNIPIDNPKGRAMTTRCLAQADLKIRSAVGQILAVVYYFAHVAEVTDTETGEVTKKVRVVMVLEDGRTVSTMSNACIRTLAVLSQHTKGQIWDPPILLEVREWPLEGGRSYCDMREVVREDRPRSKKA